MKYEIVDKASCPQRTRKWRRLFDPLPFDKAVKMDCTSMEEAKKLGSRICSSLRMGRTPYKISYRSIPEGEVAFLYVWKALREEGKR